MKLSRTYRFDEETIKKLEELAEYLNTKASPLPIKWDNTKVLELLINTYHEKMKEKKEK